MITWLLAGLGLLVWPTRPSEVTRVAPASTGRARSRRFLPAVAALAAAVGAVAVLGPGAGLACGVLLAGVAWPVVARLQARPARTRPDVELPLALDLVAAGLRAGRPLPAALLLAAPAAGAAAEAALVRVGRMLALGAEPGEAWQVVGDDPWLAPVAVLASRSADSGIRLAAAFERAAADLRATVRGAAEARAARAGVLAVAPLGLCFLPAFVCLGIVPVIVGVARTALGR